MAASRGQTMSGVGAISGVKVAGHVSQTTVKKGDCLMGMAGVSLIVDIGLGGVCGSEAPAHGVETGFTGDGDLDVVLGPVAVEASESLEGAGVRVVPGAECGFALGADEGDCLPFWREVGSFAH